MTRPDLPTAGAREPAWTVSGLLALGVAVSVAGMLVLSTSSYRQIGSLVADRASVEHTYQVLNEITALQGQLEAAETSQRGYVITGQNSFLTAYRHALPEVAGKQASLQSLTADNPRQQATLAELRGPVEDRLDALAEVVAVRRTAGFEAAAELVLTNRGMGAMGRIRELLAGMQAVEERLLDERQARSAQDVARTRALLVWGSLLAALIVGGAAQLIARRVTIPLKRVTATARRISAGDLSDAAPTSGPRELVQLAAAVQAIARSRDEALSATAAKSAFLATMSHEIRTPMNAVIGMTELLLDTELDAFQREFTEIVRDSGDALLILINEILDFSKIESGELELDDHPFSLHDCVEGALALVAVPASAKGLEVVADVEASCPGLVRGDPTRLRQILVNLLGNAVKFTESGEVVVNVSVRQQTEQVEGPLQVRVEVSDTGIGIPADRMHRLFQSFSQVDSSTTRVYGGSGLGLAISRRLAQAMGGDLQVTSEVGVGSTFTLTAALTGCADRREPDAVERARSLAGRSVLIVDDNETNCRVLRLQLSGWGMTCTDVQDPARALELLSAGDMFDVAVLDFHMPGMDGVELARALRLLPAGRELPLVLLTSLHGGLEPEQRALFAATLTKPARKAVLRSKLLSILAPAEATLLAVETAGGRRRQDAPGRGAPSLRVLLAEDNPINQKVAQLLLGKLGHRVDTVSSGREAVAAVRDTDYDVVLMDVQMPQMDGLEATQQIRVETTAERQPRIIALTASVLIEDRAACTRAGMDAYLPKPVRRRELQAVLAASLPGTGRRRSDAEPVVPATRPAAAPDLAGSSGAAEPTGREHAIRRHLQELRGTESEDDELLTQLLRSFVSRAPTSLELMLAAIDQGDPAKVEFLAHSLKGSALNLGADTLGGLFQELEAQGRSGHLSTAGQVLKRARNEFAAVNDVMTDVARELASTATGSAGAPDAGSW